MAGKFERSFFTKLENFVLRFDTINCLASTHLPS
jgi:hypothetical protein